MQNSLMQKIRSQDVALGAWINSTDPLIAEIYATFGCDWMFIDTEHEPIGRRDLMGLLLACKGTECTPCVRVPGNQPEFMKWILDLGAGGIIVPQIRSAREAAAAVDAVRYHPLGRRGVGGLRAHEYGKDSDYVHTANDRVVLMLQAEDVGFVEDMDEIMAMEGIDAIFIGQADLSHSLEHLGEMDHPDVQAAVDRIISCATSAGKAVAITARNQEELALRVEQGASLFVLGSDYRFVRDGVVENLEWARAGLDSLAKKKKSRT